MSEGKTNSKVMILGAGVTGLSAGIRLLDSGCEVSILEKNEHPGGLARTVVRGNYRLDIGPHHLFSQNESILKEILDLFESDELVSTTRDAKMFFQDRLLNYPLTAKNVLLDMGFKHFFLVSMSFIWMAIRKLFVRNHGEQSFRECAKNTFGNYMYKIFFKPYTEQFWGIPCEEMSIDCVPQAKKVSVVKILKMIFLTTFNFKRKNSLTQVERESMLSLFYPKEGIGAIVNKLTDVFLSKGGVLELNCTVLELTVNNESDAFTLHYQKETEKKQNKANHVISTIPIPSLVKILKPTPSDAVLKSAHSLDYLSTIVLYIVIHDRDFLDCSYLYTVNRPYIRVSNTNRFHSQLSPEGENMLAVEMTCHFNDLTWESSDEELFEKCIKHLEADGFINSSEVKDFFTLRVKCAYPFVRLNYRKKLEEVFNYFEKIPGISLAGRTGGFEYKDIDQCMEETANLIKQLKVDGTI